MNTQESKKLESKVASILAKFIKKNETVIAGISGGPDSIFLLEMLLITQKGHPFTIIAAHLNHKIREASDKEEKILIENLEELTTIFKKLKFETKSVNVLAQSKKEKKGVEETGRKERYDFFQVLAEKHKATKVITAHHADDNVETILLNFIRGAGLKGLSGMEVQWELNDSINLLRPLLGTPKSIIIDYLEFNKIPYFIDQSNYDIQYSRNYMRHEIIPKLKTINPNLIATISKNSSNIKESYEYIDEQATKWMKKHITPELNFERLEFIKLPTVLQKQILLSLYEKITNTRNNIETVHIEEVLTLIAQNIGNKRKKLGQISFSMTNGIVKISKKVQNQDR